MGLENTLHELGNVIAARAVSLVDGAIRDKADEDALGRLLGGIDSLEVAVGVAQEEVVMWVWVGFFTGFDNTLAKVVDKALGGIVFARVLGDVFLVLFAIELGIVGIDVCAHCWGCNHSESGLPSKLGFF